MGSKQKARFRPQVQADNKYIPPEQYPLCQGDHGCRNVVSRHIVPRVCSRCRKEKSSDRS